MRPKIARLLIILPLLACTVGGQATVIPAGLPADFDVQTATPTIDPTQRAVAAEVEESEAAIIVPLGNAPTHTPDPNATATPRPTNSRPAVTSTATLTPTVASPTPRIVVAQPEKPTVTPDPPIQGGEWDFEGDFFPWPNPHGEPCPGAALASGWSAFVERGDFGSSCINENLYGPNVFSGLKSQEITFDFIAANSGIYRTVPTKVDHRYNIVAYAKHDRSAVPVQMFMGVDLTGGTTWNGETVEWFPWSGNTEDAWVASEVTVTATGTEMTLFIRGFHPVAEQGGKTVIDNVSITDLGL